MRKVERPATPPSPSWHDIIKLIEVNKKTCWSSEIHKEQSHETNEITTAKRKGQTGTTQLIKTEPVHN